MTPPTHQEIERAVALAQDGSGLTRLLAEMLAALAAAVPSDEPLSASKRRVLERLSVGPLSPADWPGVATSERALFMLIGKLRQDGYAIDCAAGVWTLAELAAAA
jgi:hypothetical protein